ncbi:MAG: exo-1,3-beta-glucanase [Geoglossum umbratile]|nr:MAG: exo-1,3-beta-glucanase [Geoglossum umbratile]
MWAYSLLRLLSPLAVLSSPLLTGCMAQHIRADKVAGAASNQIAPVQGSQGFLRGVNIGGWLILENWLDPDMASDAPDEFTLSQNVPDAASKLQTHWQTYFTEADVQKLGAAGINAIRIPIGFWAYDNSGTPYIKGADAYLEKAIGWARNAGMKVWVDLHGAPGSQNGWEHSGHAGAVEWQKDGNIDRTIAVLKTMATKYGGQQFADTVVGLELVNEPISSGGNNIDTTKQFAEDAYKAVTAAAANQNLMVIMHDAFVGPGSWSGFPAKLNSNGRFGIDTHLYQVFSSDDQSLNQAQHIQKACGWASGLANSNSVMPTFVGEWSGATVICVNPDGSTSPSCSTAGCQCVSDSMDKWGDKLIEVVRKYVEAELDVFEQNTSGYFFWSFKGPGSWGFLGGIERGIIPNPVTSRTYPNQCGSSKRSPEAPSLAGGRRAKRGQLGKFL